MSKEGLPADTSESRDTATTSERQSSGCHDAKVAKRITQKLSITTFRYVPAGAEAGTPAGEEYLNRLNEELLDRLERGGEVFLSNAVVRGAYLLRACVVNFRTDLDDIHAVLEIVKRVGAEVAAERRPP